MKQKLYYILAVAFVAVAGYGVYSSQKSEGMSDLALSNIEALAGDESSDKGLLYGTEPDEDGQCLYCCCPGENDCSAVDCSGC